MDKEFLKLMSEKKPAVVHCKKAKYDVYIGRPSKWGNPFVIGRDGTREEVLQKYVHWILTQDHLIENVHKLRNKTLGCWCKPHACHGDILTKLANNTITELCDELYDEIKEAIEMNQLPPA